MTERDASTELADIRRELKTIRELVGKVIFYIVEAESEIPEKMRRFMNYMHDLHDIKYMYEELGHAVPAHHLREMERCDDRFRQLIEKQNEAGGTFEKVRREMAADPLNRWDHTRLLASSKGSKDETRPSVEQPNGLDEGGTEPAGSEPVGGGEDGEHAWRPRD